MKTLKKMSKATLFCLVLLITQTAVAQKENTRRGERPTIEQRLEHMTTHLELTEDQQTQVKVILENTKSELETIKGNDSEREAKKQAVHAVIQKQQEQVDKILTKEQQVKALEMREADKAKMQERRKGAKHGKRPSIDERLKKMTTELELTEDQQSAVKTVLENGQAELKTIKESDNEREEKREAARQIMKSQKEKINKILNDEQRAKFKESHPKRHKD